MLGENSEHNYINSNGRLWKPVETEENISKVAPITFHNILYYTAWWDDHKGELQCPFEISLFPPT